MYHERQIGRDKFDTSRISLTGRLLSRPMPAVAVILSLDLSNPSPQNICKAPDAEIVCK